MLDKSLYEVVVSIHDPVGVWDRLKYCMEKIIPVPLDPSKLRSNHWYKRVTLPPGFKHEFSESGCFRCRYVRADGGYMQDSQRSPRLADTESALYMYILPPMDPYYFKRQIKADLKQFLVKNKANRIIVVYGICDKDDKEHQKSNCKTIERIRRLLTSTSTSQNRLCLVPMLRIPFVIEATPSPRYENQEEFSLQFKNWDNLQLVMEDCLAESMSVKLAGIANDFNQAKFNFTNRINVQYEAILRVYIKCGLLAAATDGYLALIKYIEQDVKSSIVPQDLDHAPFIFSVTWQHGLEEGANYFETYQYLCCMVLKALASINTISSLVRACRVILDYCMVVLRAARNSKSINKLILCLVLIKEAISYISERHEELSEFKEPVNKNTSDNAMERVKGIKEPVKESSGSHKSKDKENGSATDSANAKKHDAQIMTPVDTTDDIMNARMSSLYTLGHDMEFMSACNEFKCIKRFIGMLYALSYKVLQNIDNLPYDTSNVGTHSKRDYTSYRRYSEMETEILEGLRNAHSRHSMIEETIKNSALYFSHGDLPRFSSIIENCCKTDVTVSSYLQKDTSIMGWKLKALKPDKNIQVFCWFDVVEPNTFLKCPLMYVKRILSANLPSMPDFKGIRASPCQMEDEGVNDYLHALREAKIEIMQYKETFKGYGQFLKHKGSKYNGNINVYSSDEIMKASIRVRLREDQEKVDDSPRSTRHEYEEIVLDNVNIYRGINVFKLDHVFKKNCNFIQDSIEIIGGGMEIVQKAYTPIPLRLLSGVLKYIKSGNVSQKYLLSTIMLPAIFIYEPAKSEVNVQASVCATFSSSSDPALLVGCTNYVTFHLRDFKGGSICFLDSGIIYDLEAASLFSNGIKASFAKKTKGEAGVELVIPKGEPSNNLICIAARLAEGICVERVRQNIRVLNDSQHDLSVEFIVLPPFSREVLSNENSAVEVVLEPTSHCNTQVNSVTVNNRCLIKEPTLLGQGYRFNISLDKNMLVNTPVTDEIALPPQKRDEGDDKQQVGLESTRSDVETKKLLKPLDVETVRSDVADAPAKMLPDSLAGDMKIKEDVIVDYDVKVVYRLLRCRCTHQSVETGTELEVLSGLLEYRFQVPCLPDSDVFVEYKTPPFCVPNVSFEAAIVIRSISEVSFDYDMESNEHWLVEGPVRGKNQELLPLEDLELSFKMMALSSVGGNLMPLPVIRFRRLRAPVIHKEILVLNTLNN